MWGEFGTDLIKPGERRLKIKFHLIFLKLSQCLVVFSVRVILQLVFQEGRGAKIKQRVSQTMSYLSRAILWQGSVLAVKQEMDGASSSC